MMVCLVMPRRKRAPEIEPILEISASESDGNGGIASKEDIVGAGVEVKGRKWARRY